ncbi:hypothetical protein KGF54_002234 [Candida jiufengensis]|uniref:uncharacterized protein n=1 Tax=Candida jiufengensis TaxID=497108 RepID=UPI002223F19B|nr:uncharacterized protein KGF54_002234 [Candida jiufengensis]KAI5954459.1 hypothetical protein KGF54_002234 [Candida jiufengensis]
MGVALWLCPRPNSQIFDKLSTLMSSINTLFPGQSPKFEPHITITTNININLEDQSKTRDDVDKVLSSCAVALQSLPKNHNNLVTLGKISSQRKFFQKLYFEVAKDPNLISFARIIRELFVIVPTDIENENKKQNPHLYTTDSHGVTVRRKPSKKHSKDQQPTIKQFDTTEIQRAASYKAAEWAEKEYLPHLSLVYNNMWPIDNALWLTIKQRITDYLGIDDVDAEGLEDNGYGWDGGVLKLVLCDGDVNECQLEMSQAKNENYTCLTCSESFETPQDIQKHLSTTRHKSIKLSKLDQILECEECSDSNIHQLAILRYGYNDMALLCQLCLDNVTKETNEQPSANYTLSNGALFTKLNQYLKFRDIECTLCGSDENLFVGNTPKGQVIACKNCVSQYESQNISFVGENDEKFLTELLGLKEVIIKKSTRGRGMRGRGGRRGGKRGGRRGGGNSDRPPRRPRKEDPEAEARRIHYQETKQNASDIKSGSTVKAIGSSSVSKTDTSKPSSRGNKFQNKGPKNQTGYSGNKPGSGASKPARAISNGQHQKINKSNFSNSSSKPTNANLKPNSGVKALTKDVKSMKISNNQNSNGNIESKSSSNKISRSSTPEISKNQTPRSNGTPANSNKQTPISSKKSTPSNSKKPTPSNSSKPSPASSNKSTPRASMKNTPVNSGKQTPIRTQSPNISRQQTPAPESSNSSDLILPPYITKYHPSTKLKLSYDSIDEYFREMSFNIFLEDQLTNVSNIIEPQDLMIEWYEDQDKKNNQFKVSIPMKPEVIDRFISDRFKKLKKDPFQKDQAMFLILDDDIPWYGKVATVDGVKTGKNKRKAKVDYTELVIVLYKWNNQPLPKTIHAKHLKLLPASVPVSRILNAMDTLNNENFIKMLLGKEPIKQIFFKNRVNFSTTLNDSQKAAIQSVLNNKISVVRGPPGTGKTSAIYETIIQLLESLNTYPILVVAASNIAIDNIAEKLLPKHGKSILRITANEKEKEYNLQHPLASICLHHKIYNAMSNRFQQVQNDLRSKNASVSANAYKKYSQDKFQITKEQVAQAKVILTTTVVAGGTQLKSITKCAVVIMDEATQSSEPSTLIPLAVPGVEKFVFVGDQKQLSCFSLIPSLSTSLFERVLLNETYKQPHMLNTQYRMHPLISEFPRQKFYNNELLDGITAEARNIPGIPNDKPVYFWDTKGNAPEQSVKNFLREDRGYTYTNQKEINYLKQILQTLIIEKGISRDDIGIITPYSGQRDLISSVLVKDDIINPTQQELKIEIDIDDISNDSKPVNIHIVSGIMIASIDAFQGREKNFMIMSCVRSNTKNNIGFLKDERRLNVALTRAKYGMVIVGDFKCLKYGDKLWNDYLTYLESKHLVHNSDRFEYT